MDAPDGQQAAHKTLATIEDDNGNEHDILRDKGRGAEFRRATADSIHCTEYINRPTEKVQIKSR